MKRQLFIIQEKSKSGKTIALGKLHNEFVPSKMRVIADSFTEVGRDFCSILEFNKLKIGITTHGNSLEKLLPVLEHFKDEDCNIILCESRPNEFIKMNGTKGYRKCKFKLKGYNQTYIKKHNGETKKDISKSDNYSAEQLMIWIMREVMIINC